MVRSGSSKKAIAGIIVAFICIFLGILYFTGFLGAIFQPTAPPEEYAKGYATINFFDPYTQEYVEDVDLYIQFLNGTNYLNTTAGQSFYVPDASYFFAIKPTYWNLSGAVLAQGSTSTEAYNQTISIYKIPPKGNVEVSIICIDNVYGTYTSADIPDGYHTLTFAYRITEPWYSTGAWGVASYIPPLFIPEDATYAKLYGVYTFGLWIAWQATGDGGIVDYSLAGSPVGVNTIFDIGSYNSTFMYTWHFSGIWEISGNFKGIIGGMFYIGLIDDIDTLAINF
jgi:hypothetical protein